VYIAWIALRHTRKCNGVERLKVWLRIVFNIGFQISDVKRLLSATTDWVIY